MGLCEEAFYINVSFKFDVITTLNIPDASDLVNSVIQSYDFTDMKPFMFGRRNVIQFSEFYEGELMYTYFEFLEYIKFSMFFRSAYWLPSVPTDLTLSKVLLLYHSIKQINIF